MFRRVFELRHGFGRGASAARDDLVGGRLGFGSALVALFVILAAASACAQPSQSENRLDATAGFGLLDAPQVSTPTAVPTTSPVQEPPPAGPTPIDLTNATGMAAADGGASSEDASSDGAAYAGAVAASTTGEDDGAADSGVEGDPAGAESAGAASAGSESADSDGEGDPAGAESAEPTPTPRPTPGDERHALTHDPITGEPLETDDETAASGGATQGPDATGPEVAVANGAEVYGVNCARCHGPNGQGTFQAAGVLFMSERYSTGRMIDMLTNGHPVTFGFGDKLSAAEISDVVAFVLAEFG